MGAGKCRPGTGWGGENEVSGQCRRFWRISMESCAKFLSWEVSGCHSSELLYLQCFLRLFVIHLWRVTFSSENLVISTFEPNFSSRNSAGRSVVKKLPANARRYKRGGFDPCVGKIPWRNKWQRTPVFLPGESPGQRGLADYSPWGRKESDTTERLSFQFVVLPIIFCPW